MAHRDSNLPLVVALLVVLAGHAAAVPWFELLLDPRRTPGRGEPPGLDLTQAEREIELGRHRATTSRVAWIPYEDYRELMAPDASPTRQPILQRDADPIEQAPLELDPTPPAPAAPESPNEAAEMAEPDPDLLVEALSPPSPPTPLPELALETPGPFQRPTERAAEPQPEPEQAQAAATPETADPDARPTAAPRDASESVLADLTAHPHRIQPGTVLTAGDLEITTERPRFSAVARRSAVPRNPIVELTFAPDGSVDDVTFTRNTGYDNVDRPLRTSLFRWRAAGEALERIDEPFTLTFEIILTGG